MLKPNDLPLVCLPLELSDEAAAKLVEFLHELTETLERHYGPQLKRYYNRCGARDLDINDPPF